MRMRIRIISGLIAAVLLIGICGCGRPMPETGQTETAMRKSALTVGCVAPDNVTAGNMTYRMVSDLRKAVQETDGFDAEVLMQTNITDASVPQNKKLPAPTTQAATTAPEPESFTDQDGKVFIEAVPVTPKSPLTAAYAAARLIEDGCTVMVFLDARYDAFSAWLASLYPDLYILQYEGSETSLPNLRAFRLDARASFYMAGAVAAARGDTRIGFTAGRDTEQNRAWIHAFALGAASENKDANVFVRFLGTDMDMVLEQTVPLKLLEDDECTLIAQSVLTALPVAAAAEKKAGCIGFGYDMAEDGGQQYICSVMLRYDVFFLQALSSVMDGSFTSKPFLGNTENGAVALTDLRHATDAMQSALERSAKESQNTRKLELQPTNLTVL